MLEILIFRNCSRANFQTPVGELLTKEILFRIIPSLYLGTTTSQQRSGTGITHTLSATQQQEKILRAQILLSFHGMYLIMLITWEFQ